METTELIEHLRIMGKGDDRDPNYYLLAADKLEELEDRCIDFAEILPACEGCSGKNEYGSRTEDCVYYVNPAYCMNHARENYFALKTRAEELAEENERLRDVGEWRWNPDGMDWGLGAWQCSKCGCKNDNLPMDENIKPLQWAGSKFCPCCGVKMLK